MKKKLLITCVLLLLAGAAALILFNRNTSGPADNSFKQNAHKARLLSDLVDSLSPIPNSGFLLSEPATYKNLQVFYIYAYAEIPGDRYVALDDALKGKLIVVRETENVNELKLDNKSSAYIYINSGDIVRGGKQDRTIQYDVLIAPYMKDVDLASFCVEHNRWSGRGDESDLTFSSSKNSLSSKELKVAAKLSSNQDEVWDKVGKYQDKANQNISHAYSNGSFEIKSELSASSLELTLENKELKKIKAAYRTAITAKFNQRKNAVGLACFINGKLTSIDIYNNYRLFEDLFNKLLDAAIAEAVSENAVKKYTPVDSSAVYTCLAKSERELSNTKVNKLTRFITFKTENKVMLFVTEDMEEKTWLHKNWLDTELE